MKALKNLGAEEIRLPSGHVVAANDALDVDESVLAHIDNQPTIAGLKARGMLEVADKAEPKAKQNKPK